MDEDLYIHNTEGKDDMPAHIKTTLTNSNLILSIKNNKLVFGTWQGIYLFEHRIEQQIRKVFLHIIGKKVDCKLAG
jgi:secondary thiamine-phosphate synthase enzyme